MTYRVWHFSSIFSSKVSIKTVEEGKCNLRMIAIHPSIQKERLAGEIWLSLLHSASFADIQAFTFRHLSEQEKKDIKAHRSRHRVTLSH